MSVFLVNPSHVIQSFSVLQNRAFQQVTPGTTAALNSWAAVNGGQISVISDASPVSANLRNSLQFVKPSAASAGFSNSGFWGMPSDLLYMTRFDKVL